MVYVEMKAIVVDVMINMIEKDREGDQEHVDNMASLLKNVVNVFVEMGTRELENYKQDFEAVMDTIQVISTILEKREFLDNCMRVPNKSCTVTRVQHE